MHRGAVLRCKCRAHLGVPLARDVAGEGVCGLGTHVSRKELLNMDFVLSAGPGFGDTAVDGEAKSPGGGVSPLKGAADPRDRARRPRDCQSVLRTREKNAGGGYCAPA